MAFSDLRGKTLVSVERDRNDSVTFTAETGEVWKMHHLQECCESVYIEDVCGDLADLVGTPILIAEESTNNAGVSPKDSDSYDASHTWTFYKLATTKGYVTLRWYGSSNGYYGESVDFDKIKEAK